MKLTASLALKLGPPFRPTNGRPSTVNSTVSSVPGAVAKFWRLPRVEHAGAICASEPEVARDPERPCREAEAPVEGRFQGPALRGNADPAGRLLVFALPAQLPRH